MERDDEASEPRAIARRGQARPARRLGHLCLTALALALLIPGTAGGQVAQDPASPPPDLAEASWAVQPSGPDGPGNRDWFIYTLEPGAVFGDTVAISNLSDRPIRFLIYSSDVAPVADVGGLAPQREETAPTEVGTWIQLATAEHTVEPGTRIDVPFNVRVPDDAEPGDHVGAILAIDADDAVVDPEAGDDVGFQVRQRIGARVYVRVLGPQNPALAVSRLDVSHDNPVVEGPSATVDWEITNTGNLRITPQAVMTVRGFLGRKVMTIPLPEIPELLPGGNFVGTTTVDGLLPIERFNVELEVTSPEATTERSRTFWPVPWLLLLLLLLLATWILRRRVQARRRDSTSAETEPPPARHRETVGA